MAVLSGRARARPAPYVIRHHGAQGFMDADVMTVPAAPGLILLERRSS